MLPDRVSNPGPLTYESGALPIALRGPQASEKSGLEEEDSDYVLCISMLRTYDLWPEAILDPGPFI